MKGKKASSLQEKSMADPEFFERIADQAETLRKEVNARTLPIEASTAVALLSYSLREVRDKANMVARRMAEATTTK